MVQRNVQHGAVPEFPIKRTGFWHYARRVPLAYAELDLRGVIRQSIKIRVADDL